MSSKEIQIQCSAYGKVNSFSIFSEEFTLNHPLRDAIDYARAVFMRNLMNTSDFAEQTVRICIDVALPEGWYNDAKVQTSEEVSRKTINTSTKSA